MGKKLVAALIVAGMMLAVASAEAQEKEKAKAAPAVERQSQQATAAAQERELLMNNLGALQNQEARVMVLQQLLARELGDLRQMQAVFCDQYKLDPEKFRQGGYIYDDKERKFVERSTSVMGKK